MLSWAIVWDEIKNFIVGELRLVFDKQNVILRYSDWRYAYF